MQLIEDLADFQAPDYSVVTSGTFDGVHFGHQQILSRIVQSARSQGGSSVVLTFWPHPRFVLKKQHEDLKLLSTFEEKAEVMAGLGIDFLVKIPFTQAFAEMSSEAFIQQILVAKLRTRKLIIGYDHRFGKNREGGFDYLMAHSGQYGFETEEIPRQELEHVGVSSTKIREALAIGDIHVANEFLGRPYTLSGFVIGGDRIGRSLGFPTANIDVPETYKLIPADGAYAVQVEWNQSVYAGMLNIGQRPTVSGHERRIEVNLFNFDQDLYNERLKVHFVQRLRAEQKFSSIEDLKAQLQRDRLQAIEILKSTQ